MTDYSSDVCAKDCRVKHRHLFKRDSVDMTVRPGRKYGDSVAGEHVTVDRRELENPGTSATLCTAKEYKAAIAAAKKQREEKDAPPIRPVDAVRDSINAQIRARTEDAIRRRQHDRRVGE